MKALQSNHLSRGILAAITAMLAVLGFGSESQAQHRYSPRVRQAMINYQGALTTQRNLYYQREAVYNRYAFVLRKTGQVGDLSSAALASLASQGRLSRYASAMARDQ